MRYVKFRNNVFHGKNLLTQTITDKGNLHSHEFFEVTYVVKGKIKHRTLDGETYLSNNQLFIIRPGDLHAFHEEKPSDLHRDVLIMETLFRQACDLVSAKLYDAIMAQKNIPVCPLSQNAFNMLEEQLNIYSGIMYYNGELSENMAKVIAVNIVGTYMIATELNERDNRKIYDEIIAAMQSPEVLVSGIPALAEKMNYSHGHLCRIIKTYTDKKLLDVLTEIRMEYAAKRLTTSNASMLEIAGDVGYDSLSHFINVFQKKYGVTPGKYRKLFFNDPTKTVFEIN